MRDQRGSADTEELRKAVVHYRALFDELLEVGEPRQEIIAEKRVAALIKKEPEEESDMERTYKKIEVVGVSEESFAEATQNAVAKACQTLRHVDWFEVTEMRGLVEKDKVKEFQVTVKIGFRLEDQPA